MNAPGLFNLQMNQKRLLDIPEYNRRRRLFLIVARRVCCHFKCSLITSICALKIRASNLVIALRSLLFHKWITEFAGEGSGSHCHILVNIHLPATS